MKDDVPDLSDNETPLITLHESCTDAGQINTQQKSTYIEVVKSSTSLDKIQELQNLQKMLWEKKKPRQNHLKY